jgi:predicted dehydrogenase
MAERLRVALIGCGAWGGKILRELVSHEGVEVRALADPDPVARDRARATAERASVLADAAEMRWDRIEAAVIATPVATHAALAGAALDAGVDVFVEKPLATSADVAARLAARARAEGRVAMVGHILRYHPAVVAMFAAIGGGAIGAVRTLASERVSMGAPRADGSEMIWSLGPHDVSLLRALDRSPVLEPRVEPGREPGTVVLRARTSSGTRMQALLGRRPGVKVRRVCVEGELGTMLFDDLRERDKVEVRGSGSRGASSIAYDDSVSPLRAELDAFVQCARDRTPPLTDFEEGAAVVAVLQATVESMAAGARG